MQAIEAYEHAEVNFREGVITNLDLIVASDMLSESQLQLLKNKIDYQYNLLKYKTAIGEPIF
jgi:outer membrane protein TolC